MSFAEGADKLSGIELNEVRKLILSNKKHIRTSFSLVLVSVPHEEQEVLRVWTPQEGWDVTRGIRQTKVKKIDNEGGKLRHKETIRAPRDILKYVHRYRCR